jgi:hypothetical protein
MNSTNALTLVGFQVTVDKEQGLFSFRSGNQVRLDTQAKKSFRCVFLAIISPLVTLYALQDIQHKF